MSNNRVTVEQLTAMGYDENGNQLQKASSPEIVKEKKKRQHPESRLQKSCIEWFRAQYPHYVLFAIPNGGARTAIEAAILIGEGILPGCADIFFAYPKIGQTFDEQDFHGMFVEMKAKSKHSENQIIFQKMVEKYGYKYVVCRTLDEFMEEINSYLHE